MGSGDDTLIGRGDEIPYGEGPIYVSGTIPPKVGGIDFLYWIVYA